jgi:hypothetical protein
MTFLKRVPNLSLRNCKVSEAKLAEDYCRAITQAAERSYGGRSGYSVLDFGLHMGSLLYTYVIVHVYTQFRLALDLPGHYYCVSRGVSRVLNDKMVVSDELEVMCAIGASDRTARCVSASKATPLLFLKLPFKEMFFICIISRTCFYFMT